MKPDWKDAPEWAKWLTRNGSGTWEWWEERPDFEDYQKRWFKATVYSERATGCQPTLEGRP